MNESVVMLIGLAVALVLIGTVAATIYGFVAALRRPADAPAPVAEGWRAETLQGLNMRLSSRLQATGALVGVLSWLLVTRIVGPTGSVWMAATWWVCAAALIALCLLAMAVYPRLPAHSGAPAAELLRLGFEIAVAVGLFAVVAIIAQG